MAQTKADRSAAAKKAAATRERNRKKAGSQTAGKKSAATSQTKKAGQAGKQARSAASGVLKEGRSADLSRNRLDPIDCRARYCADAVGDASMPVAFVSSLRLMAGSPATLCSSLVTSRAYRQGTNRPAE